MDYKSHLSNARISVFVPTVYWHVYGGKNQYKDRNFHRASVNTNYFRAFSIILVLSQVFFSSGHFCLHLLTADCLSLVVNNSTGMLTAPSIIFQHAAVPLPELSVWCISGTEGHWIRLPVCRRWFFQRNLCTIWLLCSAFTEFLWKKIRLSIFFLNVLHIWCSWWEVLTGS